MHPVIIRCAREADLPQILNLWVEFMQFHADLDPHFSLSPDALKSSEAHLRNRINSEESAVFVTEQEKNILGYCIACVCNKPPVFIDRMYGHISDIAVSGAHRGKGIGEKLFSEAREWLKFRGIQRIEVRTITVNDVSNSFWKKLGFQNFAEEKYLILK